MSIKPGVYKIPPDLRGAKTLSFCRHGWHIIFWHFSEKLVDRSKFFPRPKIWGKKQTFSEKTIEVGGWWLSSLLEKSYLRRRKKTRSSISA